MAVGQAPGIEEDKAGLPFVGQSGQFLSAHLDRLDYTTSMVYYTNICKCFPGRRAGGDADPPAYAIEACRPYLLAEIKEIAPQLILAVGAIAMRFFGIKGGIRQNNAKVFDTPYGRVVPILHPAGLMHRPVDTPIFATGLNIITTTLTGPHALPVCTPTLKLPQKRGTLKVGLDLETQDNEIFCVGLAENSTRTALLASDGLAFLKSRPRIMPVMHNAKFDLAYLRRQGITFDDWRDSIIEAHFLGFQPKALKELTPIFLGVSYPKFEEVVGTGPKAKRMEDVSEQVLEFCAADAWSTRCLHEMWGPIVEKQWGPLYENERKITMLLMDMEERGLPLDQAKLCAARISILKQMAVLEDQLQAAGIETPGDNEATGQRFWRNKRKLVTTKTGRLSTLAKVLRDNMNTEDAIWVEPLLKYRSLDKFRTVYIENWQGHDWLHPSLNQTGTINWRLSCSNPNLQNVPLSTGVPLYQLFKAPEGYTFVSADAVQVELVVLANESGDENMIRAYLEGRDLHDETTLTLERLGTYAKYQINTPQQQRNYSKRVNFLISYGGTDYGLSKRLGLPEGAGQEFIDAFYGAYPKAKVYHLHQVAFAEEHGYVETFMGRRLYVPGIFAERGRLRSHAEKQCYNLPISGGAQEVVKAAMLRCPKYMALQVHDELLYLVPKKEAVDYKRFLEETLPDKQHTVPYRWEVKVGDTWGDIKAIPDVWDEEEDNDD
jgi:DNA polymerase-1